MPPDSQTPGPPGVWNLRTFASNIIEFHGGPISHLNQGLRGVELGWCYVHRCFPALPAPRNACDSPWDGCRQGVEVPAVLLIAVYCRIYEIIVEWLLNVEWCWMIVEWLLNDCWMFICLDVFVLCFWLLVPRPNFDMRQCSWAPFARWCVWKTPGSFDWKSKGWGCNCATPFLLATRVETLMELGIAQWLFFAGLLGSNISRGWRYPFHHARGMLDLLDTFRPDINWTLLLSSFCRDK